MNYKRIIGTVVVKNNIAVQSIGFNKYLPIGKPEIVVEYLCSWGIDEIVVIDIDASKEGRSFCLDLLARIAKKCFVPLTIGGGIKDVETAKHIIAGGADKLCLNATLFNSIELVSTLANIFGSQCLIGSIVHSKLPGKEEGNVYDYVNKKITDMPVLDFCSKLQDYGVGEIMLNSVLADGSLTGFDLPLIQKITEVSKVPVIAGSGAGKVEHFVNLFTQTAAAAAAAGNFWNYSEHSVANVKAALIQKNISEIRFESGLVYMNHRHDEVGRVIAPDEKYLEKLLFTPIEREIL